MSNWMLFNLKDLVRDKASLFFVMVFPILMVFILGNMLAELDNADSPIGMIHIAYYADEVSVQAGAITDEEHMGRIAESTAVSMFMNGLAETDGFEIVKTTDPAAARSEVETGDADAAMIFHSPLSIEVTEGENIYKNRAALLIAQSFARQYASFRTAALSSPELFAELAKDGIPAFSGLTADKDLGVNRTMIDYYAVTMIVMIIFMGGGIGGASTTFIARQDGSLRRMSASPRSRTMLFLESVVGTLPQNIIQAGIVMVLSVVFMGAHYANSWQGNLLLFAFFIVVGLAVAALFMLMGLFMKVNPYIPIMAVLWAMLYISGTFSKEAQIDGVTEYMPMNIIQRAAFDLTVFGRPEQVLLVMGVSGILLVIACALGSALYKRKETMF
jgi:ABC-2 type transport system permease protein